MQQFFTQLGPIGDILLSVLGALVILLVGYIVARIIANVTRRLLQRTDLDNRLSQTLIDSGTQPAGFSIEELIARVVFWLIMLFVIVGLLQFLNLPGVATPIQALLNSITTDYLPRIAGAGLLLLVAWVIASVLRFLVKKGSEMLKLDERLTKHAALEEGERVSITDSVATAVFWFVFLLFLPSVLTSLGIRAIADPIQDLFTQVFNYLPNVFAAALTLLIGWFIARIVRQIVTNLLAALGVDSFGQRVGLSGERSLSALLGALLYTFILLLALIAALDALAIAAISAPATLMLTTIVNALPSILGAAIVLIVSYYIGRLVGNLIADLLRGVGFDNVPARLGINYSGTRTLSELVGYLILVAIMLFAALSASELLGSAFLSDILATFISFAGQVVLALIIFAIGLYLANLARSVVLSAGGKQANLTANLARVAVLVLAGAMALRQLGVADDIVNLAFGILLGALGVAAALAFGLGSREVAGREVERFVHALRDDSTEA